MHRFVVYAYSISTISSWHILWHLDINLVTGYLHHSTQLKIRWWSWSCVSVIRKIFSKVFSFILVYKLVKVFHLVLYCNSTSHFSEAIGKKNWFVCIRINLLHIKSIELCNKLWYSICIITQYGEYVMTEND